jgi:hypothetical protein
MMEHWNTGLMKELDYCEDHILVLAFNPLFHHSNIP